MRAGRIAAGPLSIDFSSPPETPREIIELTYHMPIPSHQKIEERPSTSLDGV
jgi:hypothetical protein